jgi:hypothetical protein
VRHRREVLGGGRPDALRGRVGRLELGVRCFQRAQLLPQRVDGRVGDRRRSLGVLAAAVVLDLRSQRLDALLDAGQIHRC